MTTVKLSDRVLEKAKIAAKAAQDNPDLPLSFICDTLEVLADIEAGAELTEFKFGS